MVLENPPIEHQRIQRRPERQQQITHDAPTRFGTEADGLGRQPIMPKVSAFYMMTQKMSNAPPDPKHQTWASQGPPDTVCPLHVRSPCKTPVLVLAPCGPWRLARRWILLSTRMSRNLASLSLRFLSRCLRMDTAFGPI